MLAKRKHVLIFDLDGTLINSKRALAEAYNLAFKDNKLERVAPREIIEKLGPPIRDVIRKLYPRISNRKLSKVTEEAREFASGKCIKLVRPIIGAAEVIETLTHKYILALISTNNHKHILKLAEAGGINTKNFRIILGEDDIKRPKPAPDGILKIKEYTNALIDYVIGDTIYDLRAAKAAGVRAIGVLSGIGTFKQLWAEKPNHIISSVAELPNVL